MQGLKGLPIKALVIGEGDLTAVGIDHAGEIVLRIADDQVTAVFSDLPVIQGILMKKVHALLGF